MDSKYPVLGNETISPETYIISVSELLRYQNPKTREKEKYYQKGVFEFFHLVRYQHAKMHTNQVIWRNRTMLPKPCIVGVIDLVRHQNAKMHVKPLFMGNRKGIMSNMYSEYFWAYYVHKCVNITLYRKTKHYKKRKKKTISSLFHIVRYQNAKMYPSISMVK